MDCRSGTYAPHRPQGVIVLRMLLNKLRASRLYEHGLCLRDHKGM